MFGATLDITYNLVVKTLDKTNQDNYGSTYFLQDGVDEWTVEIKHTIPKKTGKVLGESHLAKITLQQFDVAGLLIRTTSAWTVIKTFDTQQDINVATYLADAMATLAADVGADLVKRLS